MVTWASCSCLPSVALSVREGPGCRKMLTIHDYVHIPRVSWFAYQWTYPDLVVTAVKALHWVASGGLSSPRSSGL